MDVDADFLARRESGRVEFQGQHSHLVAVTDKSPSSSCPHVTVTLGPLAEPPAAPGTMPKLAFQRAKLSSSASNFAYSSRLLAAVGLYPIELSVRSCPGLVASDNYGTWCGTRGQIFFMWGLNRGVISLLHVCFRVGVDIHSCLGNGWSLSAVIFSGRGATGVWTAKQRNGLYFLSITATTEQSRGVPIMSIPILDLGSC